MVLYPLVLLIKDFHFSNYMHIASFTLVFLKFPSITACCLFLFLHAYIKLPKSYKAFSFSTFQLLLWEKHGPQ